MEIRGDAGGQRRSVLQGGFVLGAIRAVSRRCSVKLPCDPSTLSQLSYLEASVERLAPSGHLKLLLLMLSICLLRV